MAWQMKKWGVRLVAVLLAVGALGFLAVRNNATEEQAQEALAGTRRASERLDRLEGDVDRIERRLDEETSGLHPLRGDSEHADGDPGAARFENRLAAIEGRLAGGRAVPVPGRSPAEPAGGEGLDLSAMSADELADLAARNRGLASENATQQVDTLVRAFTEMLERFPEDRRRENTLFNLVDTLLRAQRFDEAREAALKWGPKVGLPEWRISKYLSDNAMGQRDLAQAREHSEKISRGGSEVPREARAAAEFTIAYSWYLEGDPAKARNLFTRLVDEYGSSEDPRLTQVVQGARRQLKIMDEEQGRK